MVRINRRYLCRTTILLIAVALAGCYRPAPNTPPTSRPATTPTPLPPAVPDVRIGGSAVVGEVTELINRGFGLLHPNYTVEIEAAGTTTGFEQMCQGERDMVSALRSMEGSERSACTRNNIDWLEIVIGYDVLVVVANAEDVFFNCLTTDELQMLWDAGDGQTPPDNWQTLRPGNPNLPVTIVTAGDLHPTQDRFFLETIGIASPRTDAYITTGDDAALAILEEPGAIGYLDYARYLSAEGAGAVRAVAIDAAGEGCSLPDEHEVWRGSYPLARPLYLYINVASLQRPPVYLFASYYLSLEGQAYLASAGYMPASLEAYEQAQAAIDAAAGQP
jgi:phosphate transport system substrate-binding protein